MTPRLAEALVAITKARGSAMAMRDVCSKNKMPGLDVHVKNLNDALDWIQVHEIYEVPPDATFPFADRICQRVAELLDRCSPEEWPEAMLVTADELRAIITDELMRDHK